jgi:hypothetical protein
MASERMHNVRRLAPNALEYVPETIAFDDTGSVFAQQFAVYRMRGSTGATTTLTVFGAPRVSTW